MPVTQAQIDDVIERFLAVERSRTHSRVINSFRRAWYQPVSRGYHLVALDAPGWRWIFRGQPE
jgi:hypothetical protein